MAVLATGTLRAGQTPARLGLIAGPPATTETVLAADMASLFTSEAPVRVIPMVGDAGLGNIALLLDDPRIDMAFVATEALARAEADQGKRLKQELELVARLYPQEIHVLAREEAGSLASLAGRRVNFGPEGSNSAIAAASLFAALGVAVEPLHLEQGAGISQLRQGTIEAAVIVSGKPAPVVSAIAASDDIHLLPVSFSAALESAYLPTRFEAADYPNLIKAGTQVPTVATGMALLAASAKGDTESPAHIAQFVDQMFASLDALKAEDRHPKWREINLAAGLSGYRRTPAAEAWLTAHHATPVRAMGAGAATRALPDDLIIGNDEKEALFKRFMDWQRARGH
jgi:TRAP transporter TAXI family solute receptor